MTVLQAWDFRPGENFVERMDRAMRESSEDAPAERAGAHELGPAAQTGLRFLTWSIAPTAAPQGIFHVRPDRYAAHVSWSSTGIFIAERDDHG